MFALVWSPGASDPRAICAARSWGCARDVLRQRPAQLLRTRALLQPAPGQPRSPPAAGKCRGARAAAGGGREQPRAAPRGRLLPVPLLRPAGGGSYFWRPAWRAAGGHEFSGPVWFPPTKPAPVARLLTCSWVLPLSGAVQDFSWTAGHHDFVLGHVLEATQAGRPCGRQGLPAGASHSAFSGVSIPVFLGWARKGSKHRVGVQSLELVLFIGKLLTGAEEFPWPAPRAAL